MKTLNQYIKEKLIINKDYRDAHTLTPESFDELRKIIEDRYDKLGAGTKRNPIDFNDIDVSNLNSFCNNKYQGRFGSGIFEGTQFKYIDISDWDVSSVTNMTCMFYGCEKLKSVGDISKWNVSSVTNMHAMFSLCKYFNQDLSSWDVSNVSDADFMFYSCPIKNEYKPKF